VIDLKEVAVLDGVDIHPGQSGFLIGCQDQHGQLPDIADHDLTRTRSRACPSAFGPWPATVDLFTVGGNGSPSIVIVQNAHVPPMR
jgi:hypothetical protein